MTGKSKCKILKDIRRQIAAENDIAYVTSECKYQGECAGTCPKCEAEVRYLEEELRKRRQAGKAVAVAGIAAALVVTASGCDLPETGGDPLPHSSQATQQTDPMGVPMPSTTDVTYPWIMGDVAVPGEMLPPEETEANEPTEPDTMGYLG